MIKILVIPSDRAGVSKFRSVDPHLMLEKLYPEEFRIDIYTHKAVNLKIEDLAKFDIVHFHRTALPYEFMDEFFNMSKKLGIPTIMDVDDYWHLPTVHPAYKIVEHHELPKKIVANLKKADFVTTTTPIFADTIRKINPNVVVFPNAVDEDEAQFKYIPQESTGKLRIGWLGGSSHLGELEFLRNVFNRLNNDYFKNIEVVLCGYDIRGKVSSLNQETKQIEERDILPHESVWYKYEQIFTDNYRLVSKEYKDYLMKFKQEDNATKDEKYRRVWTKPITTYASNYRLMDVALAPLKEHDFNRMKSQLKVVEAGFHKKALIAQNFGAYQLDLVHGKNALLVDTVRNHKDWFRAVKLLYDNPQMVKDLGEALYETVKEKYSLKHVTKNRREWYLSLVNKTVEV